MIEAVGLTKRYGRTLAVDNLSFTVHPGRVTGLLGPAGSGKSTTLRLIVGLEQPDAGHVLINGEPYRQLHQPMHTVGALLDPASLHPSRSAAAHLRWLARSNDLPKARVAEVLDLVGLTSAAKRRASGFSLGMCQRLGIAAALLGNPKVLLFDEPTLGLDADGILWLRKFLHTLAEQGRTVLVSSHLLSEMSMTAHDLIVIGKGRLIKHTTTTDVVHHNAQTNITIRVRTPQTDLLRRALLTKGFQVGVRNGVLIVSGANTDQVGDIAAASGVVIHELSRQAGSQEQAFMRMIDDTVQYRPGSEPQVTVQLPPPPGRKPTRRK